MKVWGRFSELDMLEAALSTRFVHVCDVASHAAGGADAVHAGVVMRMSVEVFDLNSYGCVLLVISLVRVQMIHVMVLRN